MLYPTEAVARRAKEMNKNELLNIEKGKGESPVETDKECAIIWKIGVMQQISISFRLSVVSLHDTLPIFSEAVKRSFFRFFKLFLILLNHSLKKILAFYLPPWEHKVVKNKLFFTAGMIGMLSGTVFGASDGADKGWFQEYRPYMVSRVGFQFGKAEAGITAPVSASVKKSLKSAWAGSVEFGTSHFEDRVFCGVELGYFTGKFSLNETLRGGGVAVGVGANGDIENFFAVGNLTLLRDFGERTFWYGGIGCGIVRRYCKVKVEINVHPAPVEKRNPVMWKWSSLWQAFTGVGVYLTDDWQLTAGYRLRWMPGAFESKMSFAGVGDIVLKVKQPVVHAVEVGIMRRF